MLEPCPIGSAKDISLGQRYCYGLRKIRVLGMEVYEPWPGERRERIEILAPPDLVAIWNAPCPGEWSLMRVAAGYILGLAEHVVDEREDRIPF